MKVCPRCKVVKQLTKFYKNKSKKDGLSVWCKDCSNKDAEHYRKTHQKETKEWGKKYYENHKEKIKQYKRTLRGKYARYKAKAKERSIPFNIIFEFASKMFLSNCEYCGALPDPLNGIDRVNNSIGYTESNCVPCCEICNEMKLDYNRNDFLNQCIKILIEETRKIRGK